VIARSNEASAYGDLVKFLLMVRKKVKDPQARARAAPRAPPRRPAPAASCVVRSAMRTMLQWAHQTRVQSEWREGRRRVAQISHTRPQLA